MKAEQYQIDQAATLPIGGTFKTESLHYTVHRYKKVWWALWNDPLNQNLGRELATEADMRRFMNGNWSVGRVIDRKDWQA